MSSAMTAGQVLGSYTILGKLGEGGMGEVYRARDAKLKREVALKVLPVEVAADRGRLERFQREAEVLASLNHPHIAQIFGLEESSAVTALVMELVEGEDLAARLGRGAIPIDEALPIAQQIADALEAAHEQGIIHRDLKPANIKVRPDGTVKVLDFGLAKALDQGAGAGSQRAADVAHSPTITSPAMTMRGVILGTAAYMAPEQAKGKPVDRRADIWAFGVVLYEMLTGRRAFGGDDTSEILASVLKDTPDFTALPSDTPASIRRLLHRCLERDPRKRVRDIGDVRLEMDDLASGRHALAGPSDAAVGTDRRRLVVLGAAAAIGAIGAMAGWALARPPAIPQPQVIRFMIPPPDGHPIEGQAFSPDGRYVVVAADRLYRHDLSSFVSTPLAGTEGASRPFVSPDGRWIGFFAGGKIKKVSATGGDPLTICDASPVSPGAAWGPGDTILFSTNWLSGLYSVPADGGEPRALTQPDQTKQERAHWWPHLLPGGTRALFTVWRAGSGINDARVAVLDVETATYDVLFPGAAPKFLNSGHVLYFHAGVWRVVAFDPVAGKPLGMPIDVLEDAMGLASDGHASDMGKVSVSAAGVAYRPGPSHPKRELVWASRDGAIAPLGLPARAFVQVALSPDGRRIAASRAERGAYELWHYDLLRGTEEHVAVAGNSAFPVWSPDSATLTFASLRKGDFDVFSAQLDGSNERALLTDAIDQQPLAWSSDGRRLIVGEGYPDGSELISLVSPGADGDRTVLISELAVVSPSPADRWLASMVLRSNRLEVFVQPFARPGAAVRASSNGGTEAVWSPRGKELFYRRGDELVVVAYNDDAGWRAGAERVLLKQPSIRLAGISPDGRRLLLSRSAEPEPTPGVRVVLNWIEEVEALRSRHP